MHKNQKGYNCHLNYVIYNISREVQSKIRSDEHRCYTNPMPTSLTPPPADDELECAQCGAYVHMSLSRCPNCGVNLYEPEDDKYAQPAFRKESNFSKVIQSIIRRVRGEPHPADELFTGALQAKALYDDLLRKVGGDRAVVERLITYEMEQRPEATRLTCLQNALRRWERENS